MSLDETTATLRNSMNLNTGEKSVLAHHEDGYVESSARGALGRSGRAIDQDHTPSDPETGRKHSTAASAVGKIGIKIHKLPKMPS